MLVVTPYYNKPNPRGIKAHFEAVARAPPTSRSSSTTSRRAASSTSPTTCCAELAEIDNVAAVKQARYEDIEPIDGIDLLAGNDDMLAQVMDLGGTGGILVASHLFGREMQRIVDEPDAPARDRRRPARRSTRRSPSRPTRSRSRPRCTCSATTSGGFRLPMVDASEDEAAVVREALERHGLLAAV